MSRPRLSAWPNETQIFLLKAATSNAEEALKSWNLYCQKGPIREDTPNGKLLPVVYYNLSRVHQLHNYSRYDQLKQIHLMTYARNRCLLERVLPALRHLKESGIHFCVLKGLTLVNSFYCDFGARSMTDVDILVSEGQVLAAGRALEKLGWKTYRDKPLEGFDPRKSHSIDYMDDKETSIDLHCHILSFDFTKESAEEFLKHQGKMILEDLTVGILCSADHFIHISVHGMGISSGHTVRWVADALQILRAPDFDWDRLVKLAAIKRISPFVSEVLGYLKSQFQVEIPDLVLRELDSNQVSSSDRALCRLHRPHLSRIAFQQYEFLKIYRNQKSLGLVHSLALYLKMTGEKISEKTRELLNV